MSSSAHTLIPRFANEIAKQVVTESVRVRDKRSRARRLRLVCKSWDKEVMYVLFELDLVIECFTREHPYRYQYIVDRVLHKTKPRGPALDIIRRVAERVVQSGTRNKPADLATCVRDLCSVEHIFPDEDSEVFFDQALLSAAAFYDDVAMAKEVLPHSAWLLFPDCRCKVSPILGYPLSVAARKGSMQVLHLFLEEIEAYAGRTNDALATITLCAADGNQLEALELGLVMGWPENYDKVFDCLRLTTDDRILQHIWGIVENHSHNLDPMRRPPPPLKPTSGLQRRLQLAVSQGAATLVEEIVTQIVSVSLYTGDDEAFTKSTFATSAVRQGHEHILHHLLQNGFTMDAKTLETAAVFGRLQILKHLLDRGPIDGRVLETCLWIAVERENASLFEFLMDYSAYLDVFVIDKARRLAQHLQLDSMADLAAHWMRAQL
ncbi:hypothetical protein PG997_012627 [Apiospora hydei]|uniref:Ankyrin repeat protein n=1 Tax=Apiospora hydei TaxID=1337664 RepID=A0ABR1V3W6_9PEZI